MRSHNQEADKVEIGYECFWIFSTDKLRQKAMAKSTATLVHIAVTPS